jgi:hypothetical protein
MALGGGSPSLHVEPPLGPKTHRGVSRDYWRRGGGSGHGLSREMALDKLPAHNLRTKVERNDAKRARKARRK